MTPSTPKDGGGAFAIEVGMVAVIDGPYGWKLVHVTKVTEATVKGVSEGAIQYERTYRRPQVKFAGTEAHACLLFERLKSSEAQLHEDTRNASLRRSKRNADFIADALLSQREKNGG